MQPGQITINSSGPEDQEINPGILGKTAHLLSFLMGALALSPKKCFLQPIWWLARRVSGVVTVAANNHWMCVRFFKWMPPRRWTEAWWITTRPSGCSFLQPRVWSRGWLLHKTRMEGQIQHKFDLIISYILTPSSEFSLWLLLTLLASTVTAHAAV